MSRRPTVHSYDSKSSTIISTYLTELDSTTVVDFRMPDVIPEIKLPAAGSSKEKAGAKLDTPEAYNPASCGSTNATASNSGMQDKPMKNPAKKVHPSTRDFGGQLQATVPTREDKLQYILHHPNIVTIP
ncbi:hypothetical protein F5880DRAFT_1618084 [Lentinula raphanica]|nr:hypothetical protein F5880DRAFT_1618084 [Lentinula raphanica]